MTIIIIIISIIIIITLILILNYTILSIQLIILLSAVSQCIYCPQLAWQKNNLLALLEPFNCLTVLLYGRSPFTKHLSPRWTATALTEANISDKVIKSYITNVRNRMHQNNSNLFPNRLFN